VLLPGSPAAALHRGYGPAAFTAIIGMPPGELLARFTARPDTDAISGLVIGSSGTEQHYFIACRDGQAAEVLQFPVGADGAFWGFYWWNRHPEAGRVHATVAGLDPVERVLATAGPGWNGLPVTTRAMAAWARLADASERLLGTHAPHALAAGVSRLVAYWAGAGGKASFADAADYFRIPEQDVRRADRAIRPLLALGPGRPW
jgi:hypothetical protein